MLVDTHSHLNFAAFKDDFDKVIHKCLENEVWMINVGSKYETSKKAVELAQKYKEGVFAAVGLHPIHLETGLVKIKNNKEEIEIETKEEYFDYERYKLLARSEKVVAIGEIGLDYYWKPKTTKKRELFKQKQKEALLKQLELAKELNLPVILHCRVAHNDLLNELGIRNYALRGVIHCFTGNWQQAKKFLAMGFYLGFNGIIFKKISGIDFAEVIRNTPLDRILLETDCPYLTPLPAVALAKARPQAEGRNEPLNLKYIAEQIAKTKDISLEEVSRVATENAKNLFKLA